MSPGYSTNLLILSCPNIVVYTSVADKTVDSEKLPSNTSYTNEKTRKKKEKETAYHLQRHTHTHTRGEVKPNLINLQSSTFQV
jgi:hypothetical protein